MKFSFLTVAFLLFLVSFLGCSDKDEEPPMVISVSISEGEEIEPPFEIVVYFNEDINLRSLSGISIFGLSADVKAAGPVVSVKIPKGEKPGHYTLVISGVEDLSGNMMIATKKVSFTIPSPPPPVDPNAKIAKACAQAVDYANPDTRDYAVRLATFECPGEYNICQICTIYDYLYKNWRYVSDPNGFEYFSPASRTIKANLAGDCDDYAVLMAAMIAAIGGGTRIILAWNNDGGHAYAEVYMGGEKDLKIHAEYIRDRYRSFLDKLFGIDVVGPIYYHRERSGECWLNLDWSSKYPGGPFFETTREIAVSLDGMYKVIK